MYLCHSAQNNAGHMQAYKDMIYQLLIERSPSLFKIPTTIIKRHRYALLYKHTKRLKIESVRMHVLTGSNPRKVVSSLLLQKPLVGWSHTGPVDHHLLKKLHIRKNITKKSIKSFKVIIMFW